VTLNLDETSVVKSRPSELFFTVMSLIVCNIFVPSGWHCFRAFRSLVYLSEQILLPRFIVNGLSSLDETYNEYSLALTDDLIRFWRSKVKVEGHSRPSRWRGIDVVTGASKSIPFSSVVSLVFTLPSKI